MRSLGIALLQLGNILRQQAKPECIPLYQEAYALAERIRLRRLGAEAAHSLGNAYQTPQMKDLDQAERWYQRSLALLDAPDQLTAAMVLDGLGSVACERFYAATRSRSPGRVLSDHFNAALRYFLQSLRLLPPDAVAQLGIVHLHLGDLFRDAGDIDRALPHYQEAIRYLEEQGNEFVAAVARFRVATALAQAGRYPDALAYAQAALRGMERHGDESQAALLRDLIAFLAREIGRGGGVGA